VLERSFLFKQRHCAAGEIMASLDNMLAEVVGGMPTNKGNVASGWAESRPQNPPILNF
jgi:hypothetical protein